MFRSNLHDEILKCEGMTNKQNKDGNKDGTTDIGDYVNSYLDGTKFIYTNLFYFFYC